MKRKFLSILLALSMLCLYYNPVIAEESLQLYVEANATEVEIGSELILGVYVKNAASLDKVQFTFNYDEKALKYVGNVKGDAVKNAFVKQIKKVEDGKLGAIASYDSGEAYTGEGLLWEFKFTVLDSALSGKLIYSITNTLFGSVDIDAVAIPDKNIAYEDVEIKGKEAPTISVASDKDYASQGDSLNYTISISEVALEGLQFDFDYDKDRLELIDAEWLLDDYMMADYANHDEVVSALVALNEEIILDGDIFEMNFRVKDDAPDGLAEVDVQNIKAKGDGGAVQIVTGEMPIVQIAGSDNDEAISEVEELINAIGDVTLESGDLIKAAEEALAGLTEDQKELVANKDVLTVARATYDKLVADKAAADEVVALIDAIVKPITRESLESIIIAEEAFDALTEVQKELVTNKDALDAARIAFDKLVADAQEAGSAVSALIEAIGDDALTEENFEEKKAAVELARTGYEALTEEGKVYVANYSELVAWEEAIANFNAKPFIEEIDEWATNVRKLYTDIDNRCITDFEGAKAEYLKYCQQRDEYEKNESAWQYLISNYAARLSNLYYIDDTIKIYEDDYNVAKVVIEKINAIGDVTLESGDLIKAAEEAFGTLTYEQKAFVYNKDVLIKARADYNKMVADKAAADEVISLINSIVEVNLDSKLTIETAEKEYASLTEDQRKLVYNVGNLVIARAKYNELLTDKEAVGDVIEKINAIGEVTLDSEPAIIVAENAYNALTEKQQGMVLNSGVLADAREKFDLLKNTTAAESVMELIDAIGDVTLESGDAIIAAEEAFADLTDLQKNLVVNKDMLFAKRATFDKLVTDHEAADVVIAKIDAIGEVTLDSKELIIDAEEAYELLTEDQKALVYNYELLKKARRKYESLIVYYECVSLTYGNGRIVAIHNAKEYVEEAIMCVALYDNQEESGIKRLVKIYTVDISKQQGEKYNVLDASEYSGKFDEIKMMFLKDYNTLESMGNIEILDINDIK